MVRAAASSASGGSGGLVAPGKAHGIVDSWKVVESLPDKDGNKSVGLELEVSVLAHAVEDQVGKVLHFSKFYKSKLYKLAAALGLTNKTTGIAFDSAQLKQLQADIDAGKEIEDYDFDETECTSRQFCFDIVLGKEKTEGKYKGQRMPEIGWTVLSPFDPEAKDFPKDMQMLGGEGDAAEPDPLLT